MEHKQRNSETYNRQYKSTITPTNILTYHASYNPEVRSEVISIQETITTRITTGRTQKTTEVDDNAQDCNKYLSVTIATGIPTVRITQNSELQNDDTSKSIQRSTYSTLQNIATGRTRKTAEVNDNANEHKTKPSIVFANNIPTDHIATGRTRKTTEVNDSTSDQRTLQSVSFATDIPTERTPHSSGEKNANITKSMQSSPYSTLQHIATGRTRKTAEVNDSTSDQRTLQSVSFAPDIPTDRPPHSSETLNNAALNTAMAASTSEQIKTKKIMNENLLNSIVATCNKYYQPMKKPTVDSIRKILTEAYISTDENYGIEEAIEWANGFEIPSSAVASDMRKFRAAGLDFKIMVKRQIAVNSANRLSKDRVNRLHPNNPKRNKLYDLSDGMIIPRCPSFAPNALGETTPPRDLYLRVHSAVDKMLFSLHEQGLAFILPEAEALRFIPNLNCCKAHWAKKKGKKSGRPIGDLSNGDGTPLNSEYAKLEAEKYWGIISHPTISDFVLMILDLFEESVRIDSSANWDDMVIWTMDLAGAYTLLSFRPDNANLMGITISNQRVFVFLCGVFGWTGTVQER